MWGLGGISGDFRLCLDAFWTFLLHLSDGVWVGRGHEVHCIIHEVLITESAHETDLRCMINFHDLLVPFLRGALVIPDLSKSLPLLVRALLLTLVLTLMLLLPLPPAPTKPNPFPL